LCAFSRLVRRDDETGQVRFTGVAGELRVEGAPRAGNAAELVPKGKGIWRCARDGRAFDGAPVRADAASPGKKAKIIATGGFALSEPASGPEGGSPTRKRAPPVMVKL